VKEPKQAGRRRVDSYDVLEAISAWSQEHTGGLTAQRLEMLRGEIALKRQQAKSLSGRITVDRTLDPQIRSHYELVCQQLSTEAQELTLRLHCGNFETWEPAHRILQIDSLESELQQALAAVDTKQACKLARRAAAWLPEPAAKDSVLTLGTDEATSVALQRRLLRALLSTLRFLDLSAPETHRAMTCTCRHLLTLIAGFEVAGGCLSSALNSRRWQAIQVLSKTLCDAIAVRKTQQGD